MAGCWWLVGWLVGCRCTLHVALTRMIAIVDWKYTVDSNARNPLAVIIPSVLVALIVLCRWTCAVGSSTSRTNVWRNATKNQSAHVKCAIRSDLWLCSLSLCVFVV